MGFEEFGHTDEEIVPEKKAVFSNGLTRAQSERLALLMEECGEVIQAAGKILRHGYASTMGDNLANLRKELVDVCAVVHLMSAACDVASIYPAEIVAALRAKKQYLHHQ